jgi:hypothetical protein
MKNESNYIIRFWMLLIFIFLTLPTYAVDGQIKIAQTASTTFPIVIDQPGSYVLTSNLVVSDTDKDGLLIDADDITLDLNGQVIIGPGSGYGNGIIAVSGTNITIKNGTVGYFGQHGIFIGGWGGRILENINSYGNGARGISAASAVIHNCTASYNGETGIMISGSTLVNCITNFNGVHGIQSDYSTITNCTAAHNNSVGIRTFRRTTISSCTATANGLYGIYANRSSVTNCGAYENGEDGIYAEAYSRLEGNIVHGNGKTGSGYGIFLSTWGRNYVIKNVASNNVSGSFIGDTSINYMPTDLTAPDAANANIGW